MAYKVTVSVSSAPLLGVAQGPAYKAYARSRAERMKQLAIQAFEKRQNQLNENRTSETTPPKYAESFEIDQVGPVTILRNNDPLSIGVEFGVHSGRSGTPILKYRPIGTAIILMENEVG
jgi:hypothetical protein